MSVLTTIADAVANLLDAYKVQLISSNAFAPDSVERVYVPRYGEGVSDLKLFVIGQTEKPELYGPNTTRSQCEHDYTIQVAIVQRITAGDVTTTTAAVTELDQLNDFREQVIDRLKSNKQMGNATLQDIANAPSYDAGKLDTEGVFMSVITLVYRLLR